MLNAKMVLTNERVEEEVGREVTLKWDVQSTEGEFELGLEG